MLGKLRYPPLNAVKAFEATARLGSLKAAAAALDVTSSAVSHQLKQLETVIGKRLFVRRSNSLELTAEGKRFFDQVGPALRAIARASDTVRRESRVIAMNVSTSLAQLWLIPRLGDFHKRYPGIAIEMETGVRPVRLDENVDLAITFSRNGVPMPGAIQFLPDSAIAMVSPAILPKKRASKISADALVRQFPLISGTPDGWEWYAWALANDVDASAIRIAHRFDMDCNAVAACVSGLGVMLAPLCLVERETAAGTLVPLGQYEQGEFGHYWISKPPRQKAAARQFISWLLGPALELRI